MMRLHVSIMAHPSRETRLQSYLWPRLNAQAIEARALECDVGVTAAVDTEGRGSTWTRREALRQAEGASHVLVIQDDVDVCEGFVESACHLAAMHPGAVLALAPVDGRELRQAQAMGRAWVELPVTEWTRYDGSPCSVMPARVVQSVLDAGDGYPQDDALLSDVLPQTGARVLAPAPSIAAQDTRIDSTKGGPSQNPPPPFVGVHNRAPLDHYLRQRFTV